MAPARPAPMARDAAVLALVTAVWLALHTYELLWWREARAVSRSMLASSEMNNPPGKASGENEARMCRWLVIST